MTADDARALIEHGVPGSGGTWADLGAGSGTFTRALANLLGPSGTIYAVERDRKALQSLRATAAHADPASASVTVVDADFTGDLPLPALAGVLAANALHFVRPDAQASVLGRLARLLEPGGRIVVVEYDRDRGNPWVPYPISREHLTRVAREAALPAPVFVGAVPSVYGGDIYCAVIAVPSRDAMAFA